MSTSPVHSAHLADTPAGPLTIWVSGAGVRRIEFGPLPSGAHVDPDSTWPPLLGETVHQLQQYFRRERRAFDLPLDMEATDFQKSVYGELMKIEYGHVTSYGEVAAAVGRPELARAVGQAVGANPVPIVVPCHRVVASDGKLVGFGGGLPAKVALLRLEGVEVDGQLPSSKVRPEVLRLEL
jgi:methylated-DNA-[protein]-cysteine S-methyltransferase